MTQAMKGHFIIAFLLGLIASSSCISSQDNSQPVTIHKDSSTSELQSESIELERISVELGQIAILLRSHSGRETQEAYEQLEAQFMKIPRLNLESYDALFGTIKYDKLKNNHGYLAALQLLIFRDYWIQRPTVLSAYLPSAAGNHELDLSSNFLWKNDRRHLKPFKIGRPIGFVPIDAVSWWEANRDSLVRR